MKSSNQLFFAIIFILIFPFCGISQKTWTLDNCINYAYENNIQIKRKEIQTEYVKQNIKELKNGILPDLNFNTTQDFSFGYSTELYSGDFSENNIISNRFNLSSSTVIFNGFKNYNQIKQNEINLLKSLQETDALKDDIKLNILSVFMQILLSKEELKKSKNQLIISEENLSNAGLFFKSGIIPESDIYEIKSQIAYENYQIVLSEANVENAKLQLSKLLQLQTTSIEIDSIDIEINNSDFYIPKFERTYTKSLDLPYIKVAEYNLEMLSFEKKINKSQLYPKLSLNLGLNTTWSDAGFLYDTTNVELSPIGITGFTNDIVYGSTFTNRNFPFTDQLRHNLYPFISVNLFYPVFNKFRYKNDNQKICLNIKDSEYLLEEHKNKLYQDIQQVYSDIKTAIAKYKSSVEYLKSMELTYQNTELMFKAGKITSYEYNITKNKLINAETEMLISKYELKFKQNILRFYLGREFEI